MTSFDDLKQERLVAIRDALWSGGRWQRIRKLIGDYLCLFSSTGRPWEFLSIVACDAIPPSTKWRLFHQEWSSFDAIHHAEFSTFLTSISDAWDARQMSWRDATEYRHLPKTFTIYRGQCATAPVGLSWTTDMQVAESFAYGHRSICNEQPVLLEATVRKRDVAGVYADREESEIVVFDPDDVKITVACPWVKRWRDTRKGGDFRATMKTISARWPARQIGDRLAA